MMKRKNNFLITLLIIVVIGLSIGCIEETPKIEEDYSTNIANIKINLEKAIESGKTIGELQTQEKYLVAEMELINQTVLLAMAEKNLTLAQAKGAPEEIIEKYDKGIKSATFLYFISRGINKYYLFDKMYEDARKLGYTEDRKERMIALLDESTAEYNKAERVGEKIILKYPIFALEEMRIDETMREITSLKNGNRELKESI